jgi:Tol biopolymer transport system component
VLFWGHRDRERPPDDNVDWYVSAVAGGAPTRTNARRVLLREGFETPYGLPMPDWWADSGSVVFHAHVGDSSNTWQVAIPSKTWQIGGSPARVTFGTTDEAAASVSTNGHMVFMSLTGGSDIWSLPIDADRGKPRGELTRLTPDVAEDYDPSLSTDGGTLVFRSRRAGNFDVVSRHVATGKDTMVTQSPSDEHPVISPDGTKVAYSLARDGKTAIFVVGLKGGSPELVCADCGEVEQWAPDGRDILFLTSRDPSSVGLLRLGSQARHDWLSHKDDGVFNARLSPDGHWVAFNARADRLAPARVLVARVGDPSAAGQPDSTTVAAEREWVVVTEDGDAPAWSPGGSLLYFWSNRDGSPCLWAQRLDSGTRRPVGSPLVVRHFHSRGLSWRNLYRGAPDIAVARDRIVFNLGEHSGNVWMTELSPAD